MPHGHPLSQTTTNKAPSAISVSACYRYRNMTRAEQGSCTSSSRCVWQPPGSLLVLSWQAGMPQRWERLPTASWKAQMFFALPVWGREKNATIPRALLHPDKFLLPRDRSLEGLCHCLQCCQGPDCTPPWSQHRLCRLDVKSPLGSHSLAPCP